MRWFAELVLCTLLCFVNADRTSFQYRSYGYNEKEVDKIAEVLEGLHPLNLREFFIESLEEPETKCEIDLNITIHTNPQDAFKYWSSFAVPWTGLGEFRTLFIGQPEQCTNAKIDLLAVKVPHFPATKPFLLNIPFVANLSIKTGICMPASCSNSELKGIFGSFFQEFGIDVYVTSRSNFEADAGFYIACVIYAILITLVATGTSLAAYRHYAEKYERASSYISLDEDDDVVEESNADARIKTANGTIVTRPPTEQKKDSLGVKFLLCFNFYANVLKIIAAPKQDGSQLSVLNGIRTMSLGWVVIAHMFLHELETGVQDNPLYLVKLVKNFLFQPFANASLSVDSFFVMSGMLVMMGTLKALEKRRSSIQFWIMFYVHRFIRLWPALLLTIVFIVGFYPLLAEAFYSPLFQTDTKSAISNQCKGTNWITVALFVNNYDDINDPVMKPCMTWTWYLADDMQFYAVSPIFVVATKYSRKAGIGLISLCIFISTLANVWYSAAKDLYAFGNPLAVIQSGKFNEKLVDNMYEWPWMRFQIYGIGLLLGIVMHEQDRVKRKFLSLSLNTRIAVVVALWFYALVASGVAVYGCYPGVNGHPMGNGASAMYNATFRVLWSTALGVMIILCAWGYGGALNRALGSNFWVPFARVGYTAYIIHVVLLWLWLNSAETTVRMTTIYIAIQFMGIVTLVYCVAIVWSCLIEAPFIQVEKLIFAR